MTLWHDQTARRERSHVLEDQDRVAIQAEQVVQPGTAQAAR